ncbi:hypothetical protein PtA15_8A45 [Puccinia triticina]|uniref:RCC1-like domain-containing protein n=1 Tax=Puccinia triticina TaxID=208348 RepID=A0ABY7CR59_9BASI|nr:uncharacterized protein PtA15_8A45 [Puccinia triticina]WAQ87144.1 hypothetical protein PtA15_8A45 [Puccinia triticina]WAR57006.1 hypothetical protein PtB15_8B50 [Puccinia triticina]
MGRPKVSAKETPAEGVQENTTKAPTKKRGRPKKSDAETRPNGVDSTSKPRSNADQDLPIEANIDPVLFEEVPPSKRQKPTIAPTKPAKPVKSPRPSKVVKPSKAAKPTKTDKAKPQRPAAPIAAPKPLFTTKALRSNFNPLPQVKIEYSSEEQVKINVRCGNPLNSMKIDKHEWLKQAQPDSHVALIFGAGDMGQMGMGAEKLDDVRKPAVHSTIEELRKKKEFAEPIHLAAGGMHTLVIDSEGKIWSWGINDNAALGRKTEGILGVEQEELETRPMCVATLSPQPDPESGRTPFKAARACAGDSVSVAVSEEGELVAWGSFRSNDGLLGFDGKVGTSPKQLVPTRVSNLREYPVSQVVCGYDHVLALTTEGHVYSWGNGQQQQLGRKIIERRKKNGLTPERLSLKKIVLLGTGGSHSFAVHENGTVFGWGLNTRGQLGISSEEAGWEDEIVSVPTPVRAMAPDQHDGARVVAIEGGDFHTLFLLDNGQVWAVGNYENSEIGIAHSAKEIVAAEEERKAGTAKKKTFVEEELKKRKVKFESSLVKYNERLAARKQKKPEEQDDEEDDPAPQWDEMAERLEVEQEAANQGFVPGQCLRTPARVEFPHPVIDISCGTRHNLAVDNQGNAYSWGLGQSNELGQGKDEDGEEIELVETPKILTSKALNKGADRGTLKVVRCAAGGTHSLLIAATIPSTAETNGTS